MDQSLEYIVAYGNTPTIDDERELEALGFTVGTPVSEELKLYRLSYQGNPDNLENALEKAKYLPAILHIEPDKSDYSIK
jgi:hypothetical protein